MDRRIFGLETEYGVACTSGGTRRLTPDEVARYLFRRVVTWGRSSNVFLRNGSRIYLDVGSHPEYATAECDDLIQLINHDRAGERILEDLIVDAEQRLASEGISGDIYLFKNNTDSHGNSYGCHENYLISRVGEFAKITDVLVPFLVSRQLICGAGKILHTARGAEYSVSQRAEHIWESRVVGDHSEPADHQHPRRAACRSRAVSAAARHRRRLEHVRDHDAAQGRQCGAGAAADRGRRADAGLQPGQPDPGDPRHEPRPDRPGDGRVGQRTKISALELQTEYYEKVSEFVRREGLGTPSIDRVLDLWERTLRAVAEDKLGLVDTEIDWAIKYRLLERYSVKHNMSLADPRIAQLDLAYHDIRRNRGIFALMEARGLAARATTDPAIFRAKIVPPQTTRAKLRGDFIKAAQEGRNDYTVDWVHLKLNDQAQRTVLCKDPFVAVDERVDRLIASMRRPSGSRCSRIGMV